MTKTNKVKIDRLQRKTELISCKDILDGLVREGLIKRVGKDRYERKENNI